jgi:hypothetical protein
MSLVGSGWIGRTVRALGVALLAIAASGTVPVAATCVEDVRGCGDMCARCACKERAPGDALRAPCACCKPQPGVQPITLLGPAILSATVASSTAPQLSDLEGRRVTAPPSVTLPVPHPPPESHPAS